MAKFTQKALKVKITRRYIVAASIFIGCSFAASAQEIVSKGVVMDYNTNNRIALADVLNQRNGFSVGSNDMGFFQIKARVGDTLVVTKRGYSKSIAVVRGNADIVFRLQADVNYIGAVEIKSQTKKAELDAVKRDFKRKGSFYSGKPPILAFLTQPLTALYELLGRTPKNARRFSNYYQNELEQQQVDRFFNPLLIRENTSLDEPSLKNFMINYRPSYETTKNWTKYDAVKYIRDSFKKYSDSSVSITPSGKSN